MFEKAARIAATLARADMVFYLLPALMLLLVVGTIAQKPMGLYAAQKIFFSGPLGFGLIGLIAVSLAVKFFLHSDWSWRKAGINISHFGILVLLFGGLLTSLFARESFMVIPENTQSRYLYDYHQRNLYIFHDNDLKHTIPFDNLKQPITGLPFEIKIGSACANCVIQKREEQSGYKGMAQFMALKPAPVSKEPEANLPGLTFSITGAKDQDGTYIAFEGMPEPVVITAKDDEYKIIFGKQQSMLPFAVRLKDFTKDVYPGTDKAKGYSSDLTIIDGAVEWPARIEMNKPLRYKGYTFYQSSFEQTDAMQATILSVVENKGRIFPYLGTLIIAVGLLLHIFIVVRERA